MKEEKAEIRVKFKIGEIEFEAEGSAELVERERSIFSTTLLPSAIDAIVRTRGSAQAVQYVEATENQTELLMAKSASSVEIAPSAVPLLIPADLSRTSLASFVKGYGPLSDMDFALIAAYYDEKKNGIKSFTSESVKQYYLDARRGKYSNYSDLLQRLVQKGYIMDDPNAEKKIPKPYMLTDAGIQYVESYQPKENGEEKIKQPKSRKVRNKQTSTYSDICADDLNLKNYPEVKTQDSFKKQMMLTMYIFTNEGKGDFFSATDIEYIMLNILGLPASIDAIKGIFKRNKVWFKVEQDETNKKAYKYKLLEGAKDYAQSVIDGTAE